MILPSTPTAVCGLAALTVAMVFYGYRAYRDSHNLKERKLRDRVAYMLWVAATGFGD